MELSNASSELVLSNRYYEEVSHRITIIHVLVVFRETLVKSNWYSVPVLVNLYLRIGVVTSVSLNCYNTCIIV